MANLKVLDGDAAVKYLSTDGAGTDADPHISHHVLDENTDGVYIGDIKFGESLLAGTNAIGKLAANSGVDIGDVTINNASGAAAVNIQDGGNTITIDGTVAATQSGTWNVGTVTAVTTVSTLTTITNPVSIKNAADDTVTGISGTYDTIDVSLTNGTYRAAIDSSGYLTTNINGTVTVDGSITADTELPAAAALSDALANPTAPMIGAALLGYDNTNSQWERLRTNDLGVLRVVGNGTAGSADAAVVTVQGVASATPVIVTGDSAGSLTIDNATLAVVGGGAEATALRVTIANDSTGVLTVDDGGSSLTVDGTVTATPSGIQEIEGDEAEGSGNLPQPVLIGGDDGTDVKNINVDATTGDVQVDVTNQVDVGGATPVVTPVTGNASPFSTSYAPSADFWLESLTLHLSAAGTTAESFTATLNATDGAAYDTVLFSQDLSKGAVTDLVWVPEGGPMLFENGDAIDVAWANSESRTYGLRIASRLA